MHHKLACFANGNFYFFSVLLSTKGHLSRCSDNLPKRREFCVGKLSAESGLLLLSDFSTALRKCHNVQCCGFLSAASFFFVPFAINSKYVSDRIYN